MYLQVQAVAPADSNNYVSVLGGMINQSNKLYTVDKTLIAVVIMVLSANMTVHGCNVKYSTEYPEVILSTR